MQKGAPGNLVRSFVLRVKERGFCSLAEGNLKAEPTKDIHREEEEAKN